MKALNSKTFLLAEGLEDRAEIVAGRAAMAVRKENVYDIEKEKKFKARRKADRIGLVYWPALLEDYGVDPWAYVYAEEVLTETHLPWGTRVGDVMSHGGWDMQGHYGVSPSVVARAWKVSGCRNSAKFRWLVSHWNAGSVGASWGNGWGFKPRKADSVQDLEAMAKGARHVAKHSVSGAYCSRKTLRFLGRVSSGMREALLSNSDARTAERFAAGEHNVVRIRHLDFESARRLQATPIDRRGKWDSFRTVTFRISQLGPWRDEDLRAYYAPGFPGADLARAQRLGRGESPLQILPEAASRKEAHAALTDPLFLDAPYAHWLAGYLGHDAPVRSLVVCRWLGFIHQSGRWSKLTPPRVAHGPAGQAREFRFLDIVDEVDDADIVNGKDRVEDVFHRAAERLVTDMEASGAGDPFELLARAPEWAMNRTGITPLLTRHALQQEGRRQSHCVGGYWQSTQRRQSLCVSVRTQEGRSTAELSWDGRTLYQHHGFNNKDLPLANRELIQQLVNELRGKAA